MLGTAVNSNHSRTFMVYDWAKILHKNTNLAIEVHIEPLAVCRGPLHGRRYGERSYGETRKEGEGRERRSVPGC